MNNYEAFYLRDDLEGFVRPPLFSDFHTHTCCSDGELTPEELVGQAAAAGIRVLAVTDHDNANGVAAAERAAADLPGGRRIRIIPGAEMSATWSHGDFSAKIHVACLFLDPSCPEFASLVADHLKLRIDRARKVRDRLAAISELAFLSGEMDQLVRDSEAKGVLMNRRHFARFLHDRGVVASIGDAMDKYLQNGRPAAVRVVYSSLERVLGTLLAAGGIPVLAHPLRYRSINQSGRRDELLDALCADFRALGGRAVEILTPHENYRETFGAAAAGTEAQFRDYTRENAGLIADLARRHGLACSVGSDYHGAKDAPDRFLGIHQFVPAGVTPVWESDERFKELYK